MRTRRYDIDQRIWLLAGFLVALAAILVVASCQNRPSPPNERALLSPEASLCMGGCPTGSPSNSRIITHHILVLSNNPVTKFADWVSYRISRDTLGRNCARRWQRDPKLTSDITLDPADYEGIRDALQSDRGHQAPLASLCGSPYWQEANYLSNITPQKMNLNQGAWAQLEGAERSLLSGGFTQVFTVTGPLFEREMPHLPRADVPHSVPSSYWKVISVERDGRIMAIAFVMDQSISRDEDYCSMISPLGQVRRRTRLEFFPTLSVEVRRKIEEAEQSQELQKALGC